MVKDRQKILYLMVGISGVSPPHHHHSNQEGDHEGDPCEGDSDVHVLVLIHLHPAD